MRHLAKSNSCDAWRKFQHDLTNQLPPFLTFITDKLQQSIWNKYLLITCSSTRREAKDKTVYFSQRVVVKFWRLVYKSLNLMIGIMRLGCCQRGGRNIRWNYHQKLSYTQSHIPRSLAHTRESAAVDSWSRSRQDDSEGYHYSSTNKMRREWGRERGKERKTIRVDSELAKLCQLWGDVTDRQISKTRVDVNVSLPDPSPLVSFSSTAIYNDFSSLSPVLFVPIVYYWLYC